VSDASQEVKVEPGTDKEPKDDAAEFSGAWDELKDEAEGQPAPAAGRQEDEAGKEPKEGEEAGQGEAPAGQPDAGTTPAADAAQASRAETSDDVWANADPKLREAHEKALKEAEEKARKAENLARSNGGRLTKALNELDALRKAAPSSQAGAEGDETSKQRRERIAKVQEEYPEVAAPLIEEIADLRAKVDGLSATATARAETEVEQALADEHAALLERHPDLPSIIAAPEYADWIKGKSPAIQRIIQENSQAVVSAEDAALVFDLFKAETGFGRQPDPEQPNPEADELARKRERQLEAGRSPTGAQPGVRRTNPSESTYDEAWEEMKAQDRRAAGRR
jgi:hypothetical protein